MKRYVMPFLADGGVEGSSSLEAIDGVGLDAWLSYLWDTIEPKGEEFTRPPWNVEKDVKIHESMTPQGGIMRVHTNRDERRVVISIEYFDE